MMKEKATIKAISLWQPWASLMAAGMKQYETRSWATKYRGPLLICTTKSDGLSLSERGAAARTILDGLNGNREVPNELLRALREMRFCTKRNGWGDYLPTGKALALVDLTACIPTETMASGEIGRDHFFGDFTPGRFAWKSENVRAFKRPFVVRGRQGLFDVTMEGEDLENLLERVRP